MSAINLIASSVIHYIYLINENITIRSYEKYTRCCPGRHIIKKKKQQMTTMGIENSARFTYFE